MIPQETAVEQFMAEQVFHSHQSPVHVERLDQTITVFGMIGAERLRHIIRLRGYFENIRIVYSVERKKHPFCVIAERLAPIRPIFRTD